MQWASTQTRLVRFAAFWHAKRTFGERSLYPLLRAKRSLPNADHEAPLSSGPRLSRAQTGIRPASCCGLAAAQCSLKTTNYFCNQVFSTGFFHVEFTKGVYCSRINYGQRGI